MSYYSFNRQKLLKKAKEKYDNKDNYEDNKEAIKKSKNNYKKLIVLEKKLKKKYSRNRYNKLKQQYKG